MKATIKPCPFCGGAAAAEKKFLEIGKWRAAAIVVQCNSEEARCWVEGPARDTEEDAIAVWNRRFP